MDHGDVVAGETSPLRDRGLTPGALADHQHARCGAMMQQGYGHGLQSWPQQFVRLVGGHRRPPALRAAPAQN